MLIEKALHIPAPIERVWGLILDPQAMTACIPGVEAIEVLSPTEYLVSVEVKVGFVGARFRVKTRIEELRAPCHIRSVGAGEDATLTSTLRLASVIDLEDCGDGTTDLRSRLEVELLGRLGTFGLNAVKTKADRIWIEFGENFEKRAVRA